MHGKNTFTPGLSAVRLVSSLAVLIALAGCATLSEEECLSANWAAIGERDGASGYDPQSRFAGHLKACTKAGVTPDQIAWQQGFESGLVRFCTPQNGLHQGQQGASYNNVCPSETAADFLAAYGVGKRAYTARSALDGVKRDIRSKQDSVSELLKNFAGMTQKDQLAAQHDIAVFNAEILRLQSDVVRLSAEVARSEQDVADYRQRLLNGS